MNIAVPLLILFVCMNSVFKLSLWRWWQRFVFSGALAAAVVAMTGWASAQSKTAMAELLADAAVMQDISVLVTVDTVICAAYCLMTLGGGQARHRAVRRMLKWYPGLLMFPVALYLLAELMFVAVGVPFGTTALLFAAAVALLPPLLAEAARWLVPDEAERVEMHLLTSLFVCLFGLLATQTTQMVYAREPQPTDWKLMAVSAAAAAVLLTGGYAWHRLHWKRKTTTNSRIKNT